MLRRLIRRVETEMNFSSFRWINKLSTILFEKRGRRLR